MTYGIYAIVAPSRRRYVGQSQYIEQRFEWHHTRLQQGKHHCVAMQHEWNSCKPDKLDQWRWSILTVVPSDISQERLDELEASFINNSVQGSFNTIGVEDVEET